MEPRKEETVNVFFVPIREMKEVSSARVQLRGIEKALAGMLRRKAEIKKSYEMHAKEADLQRKHAKEIEKKLENLKTRLKALEEKEAKAETKERIRELQEELKQSRDAGTLAASKADLEILNEKRLDDEIKLFEEKEVAAALEKVGREIDDLYRLGRRILTPFFLILVMVIIRVVLLKLVGRYVRKDEKKYYYNKIIKVGSWAIVIFFILLLLIGQLKDFIILISFLGAGVAISLRDVIASFVAWFFIVGPNGFHVGDRIELGDVKGDVVDVSLFRTSLMEIGGAVAGDQSAGRIATFPNHLIFSNALYNYTTGYEFIWNEISFLITFESNWRRAEELMLNIAREGSNGVIKEAESKMRSMSTKYMLRFGTLTPAVYLKVADSGVELTVRYLTAARMRRVYEDKLSRAILDAINAANDVELAYPTIRYYDKGERSK